MSRKTTARSEADADAEAPAMRVERVPIDSVHPDPANARRHPERNLDAIKASLARFGQQKPVVVDAAGIVRAGNGTLAAAKALGWDSINIIRTSLRGSEATAYAISDNRTAELAIWDETALAETLRALQNEDFDLESVGYEDAEVDRLIEGLGNDLLGEEVDDPAGEWEGMPEFEHEDKTAHRTLAVHFKSDEDVEDFSRIVGQPITDKTKYLWHPRQEIIRYGDAE